MRGRFIAIGIVIVLIFATVAAIRVNTAVGEARDRRQLDQFINQGNESLLYDFNYLMHILEENWPFFNLSKSVNGVDIHQLADDIRSILSNPATDDMTIHEFLDFLRVNFFWEVGRIGHLNLMWRYNYYFTSVANLNQIVRDAGATPTNVTMFHEIYTRPNTALFYQTLRDMGGSTLEHPDSQRIAEIENLSVYETAILQDGSIAYLAVRQMLNLREDPRMGNMGQYEAMLYEFYGQIEGFDHLIIDMRGNTGGVNFHFNVFVVSPLLYEEVTLPAYVFYKDGDYSRRLRETFDLRMWGVGGSTMQAASFSDPLPYLDTKINFAHAYYASASAVAGYTLSNLFAIREDVLFNGNVWILVDENTGSAAESAVAMLKFNNLATVVGEATHGIFGVTTDPIGMTMSLPNTGMLIRFDVAYYTDTEGRPLQGYGIQPHYFNRPNMDALETVMAMIAEIDNGGN